MLLVTTTVRLDPDRRAEALDLITNLVERSREEPGTIAYHATTDLLDPNVVRFVERYEEEAALESHTALAAYRRFNERLPDLMVGDLETWRVELTDPPERHRLDAGTVAALPDETN